MKKSIFNKILDIKGKAKKYPNDGKVAFFKCDDETYYIYALYTKQNYTDSELIEVNEDTFIKELAKFEKEKPVLIHCPDRNSAELITIAAQIKTISDGLTVGDLLTEDLNKYIAYM